MANEKRLIDANALLAELDKFANPMPNKSGYDLTEDEIRAYRLADNKTAELAGWDFDKLDAELATLSEMDMAAFGFKTSEDEVDAPKERDDLSDKVNAIYEVIVECADEFEQEEIFTRLSGEGLQCRVLTL